MEVWVALGWDDEVIGVYTSRALAIAWFAADWSISIEEVPLHRITDFIVTTTPPPEPEVPTPLEPSEAA